MTKKQISRFLILVMITVSSIFNAKAIENDVVIAQMNSCVNTLTNIINNKSMAVLEHETDQLLNNLTIQHIVGLPEIAEFRVDLIDAISSLGITEEERNLLKRINSIKQDNLKWQALSNALNNTMLITGGGNTRTQAGFMALVTAARTAVEYKTAGNELQIEELQAMWELRKEDLKTFANLRKEALSIIFSLYQKYNLKESDRLTEQSSQQFQRIISERNPQRMVRLLLDNSSKFGHIDDYYYFLGMGYLDCGDVSKAMEAFNTYDSIYSKAPIYRQNEKSGLISLARLAYNTNFSNIEIEKEIANVVANIPNNSMAIIQCAITYNTLLNNPSKALSLLRTALDNDVAEDKTAIILAASMILPNVPTSDSEYVAFTSALNTQGQIDFDAQLNMIIAHHKNVWEFLSNTFTIKGLASRPWYRSKWILAGFFCDQSINVGKKITFTFPNKYTVDLNHLQMWVEKHEDNKIILTQYDLSNPQYISLQDVEDLDCFKHNPNLKYLYMESVGQDIFIIKQNLDYAAIEREDFPRQSEFALSEKDVKNILKFLKKHEVSNAETEIVARKSKDSKLKINKDSIEWEIRGDSIDISKIQHTALQNGISYVKFFMDDIRKTVLCYKYDNQAQQLMPCFIQYQGKRYFYNKAYLVEFGYQKTPVIIEERPSWWSRNWTSFTEWCSEIWCTICGWF